MEQFGFNFFVSNYTTFHKLFVSPTQPEPTSSTPSYGLSMFQQLKSLNLTVQQTRVLY